MIMKARLPQGMNNSGGAANIQQLARQAQKMQENIEKITAELEEKEYTATSGGGMVTATVSGKLEVKSITMNPEIVDPEDVEMLCDVVTAAVNEAIRSAVTEKDEKLNAVSGGLNVPGLF